MIKQYFKKQYRDLEMNVMACLREAINNSEQSSKHIDLKAIQVNLCDYTELVIVNDSLTFLDANGQHYSVFSDCSLEDLIDILNKQPTKAKWICTDPDFLQFCKPVSSTIFEFKEYEGELEEQKAIIEEVLNIDPEQLFEQVGNAWREGIIDLNDYSMTDLNDFAKAGYQNLSVLMEQDPSGYQQVLAELIWENE